MTDEEKAKQIGNLQLWKANNPDKMQAAASRRLQRKKTFWYDWRSEGSHTRKTTIVFWTKSFVRLGEMRLGGADPIGRYE